MLPSPAIGCRPGTCCRNCPKEPAASVLQEGPASVPIRASSAAIADRASREPWAPRTCVDAAVELSVVTPVISPLTITVLPLVASKTAPHRLQGANNAEFAGGAAMPQFSDITVASDTEHPNELAIAVLSATTKLQLEVARCWPTFALLRSTGGFDFRAGAHSDGPWKRMTCQPKHAGADHRIDTDLIPPRGFIAASVHLAMVSPT